MELSPIFAKISSHAKHNSCDCVDCKIENENRAKVLLEASRRMNEKIIRMKSEKYGIEVKTEELTGKTEKIEINNSFSKIGIDSRVGSKVDSSNISKNVISFNNTCENSQITQISNSSGISILNSTKNIFKAKLQRSLNDLKTLNFGGLNN